MNKFYYIYDAHWDGVTKFKTKDEWLKAIEDYDFFSKFYDDGWSEEVEYLVAGLAPYEWEDKHEDEIDVCDFYHKHATYITDKINEESRPDELDEDECDENGTYWGVWEYRCDYTFVKKQNLAKDTIKVKQNE